MRDTTLDVHVLGSGFDNGSRADFLLNGATDPKVVTNSTLFVSSSEVVANITIVVDALPAYRDVAVTTSTGKKGIGTAKFQVLEPFVIPIPGATSSQAWDVNGNGQAVGNYSVSGVACSGRGFSWSDANGAAILAVPAGYCDGGAKRVNEQGLIVGTVNDGSGVAGNFVARWIPAGPSSWTIEVLPRPTPGLVWLTLHGVNAAGSIVSRWRNPDLTTDVWFWSSSGGWVRLTRKTGSTSCEVEALSTNDEVVGYCNGTAGTAVYWASPSAPPIVLPAPTTGFSSGAGSINSLGVIGGSWIIPGRRSSEERIARWRPNGPGAWLMDDLAIQGRALDIIDDGTILGLLNGDPFVVLPGGTTSHLDPLNKTQGIPWAAMGNRGQSGIAWIAGWGKSSNTSGTYALIWKR